MSGNEIKNVKTNPSPTKTVFPKGTKINVQTGDTLYSYEQIGENKFKNTTTGKIVSYNELFPNNVNLDVNNDGKYDKKDYGVFKQMGAEKTAQKLSKSVTSDSQRHIPLSADGPASSLITFNGNDLGFCAFKKKNDPNEPLFGKQYTIDLPK